MKKQIAILGSTGSIGTQALQVIEEHPDLYEAYVLTANNRVDELIAQARKFQPEAVVIANKSKYPPLKEALSDLPIKVYAGEEALCQIVQEKPVDIVLTAMVGYAGLKPTINAIRARKTIALANKETLVVAGDLINDLARVNGTPILPVDSEHSAVFQCLAGEVGNPIEKVILTASGGGDRGQVALRGAPGADRSGGASAIGHSLDGAVRRRSHQGTTGDAGHAPAHPVRLLLPRPRPLVIPPA